jgi:endoglucanase
MRPHRDPTTRVLHRPSTGAALHLAAAAARGSRTFETVDAAYAARLLTAARTAYAAAQQHPVLIAPDDGGAFGGGPYGDDDLSDDLFWAAVELGLPMVEPPLESFPLDGFDFDRVGGPARLTQGATEVIATAARRLVALQQAQPWGQPYAPDGPWSWGSNGRLLNNLMVLGSAYELTDNDAFRSAVCTGADYLFGRNALGQSYVAGYGTDTSRHQRTRHYAHDLDPTFPPAPHGAVVGGPTNQSYPGFPDDPRLPSLPPQLAYVDAPTSETTNDVCIRWNAPLVWVAAFLTVTS